MPDFANLAELQAWNARCFGTQSVVRRRTLNAIKYYRNKIFLNIVSLYIQCIINAFTVPVLDTKSVNTRLYKSRNSIFL